MTTFSITPIEVFPPGECAVTYSCALTTAPVTFTSSENLCFFVEGANMGAFNQVSGDYSFMFTDRDTYPPGVYTFTITASVGTVPTETTSVTFDMTLVDQCEPPAVVTPSAALTDLEYIVGDPIIVTPQFNVFIPDPNFCPLGYTYSIAPATTGIGSVITFDDVNRQVSVETSDLTFAGVEYTVTVSALSPIGIDTGSSFNFVVKITDPCDLAILTADLANVAEVSYTISDNPFVFASPTLIPNDPDCTLNYTFDVVDPTVKAALTFTDDPINPTFSLFYSTDLSIIGTHSIEVTGTTGVLG